jgi:hypothetical protein
MRFRKFKYKNIIIYMILVIILGSIVCYGLYQILKGISRKVRIHNINTYVKPEIEEV